MNPAPEDRDRLGAIPRERECVSCLHPFHLFRCAADLLPDVTCPCRCPVPGIDL